MKEISELFTLKLGVISNSIEISMNKMDVSHMKICILTETLSRINEEVSVVADNRVFEVGVYEVDDDWKPFSCSEESMAESDEEDDDDDISNTVFDTDEGLEDGEIVPNADTEQVPDSEIGRNSLVDDSDEIPGSRATVAPGNLGNQHIESSHNDEVQQSNFNSIIKESHRNIDVRMEVNDGDDDGESRTPQLSFGNICELIPRGVFGPFPNNGLGERDGPSKTLDLEMDPNGSFLKRRKIHQVLNNPQFNIDQSIPKFACSASNNPSQLDLN
ncbi:unnamed protein product [Lactuca saligna]|uniref:Uncharacterized protein n=1 Tax=Lactuca saligna TaxID=75948 RepID=A0AA35YJT3_LACSI|nr:unnamed protein product [Lactuca saligna]